MNGPLRDIHSDLLCVPDDPHVPGEPDGGGPGTRLRILVVDDEAGIRRALRRMLARDHQVETAGDGLEARERLASSGPFDVILCDLMMPGMTGMQLYEALAALDPGQAERVVFMTGGSFTEGTKRFLERSSNPLLHKPLSREGLESAFRAVLEAAPRLRGAAPPGGGSG